MMKHQNYYINNVLPYISFPIVNKYDKTSLLSTTNYHSLGTHNVIMLVALTGTGKTTTLNTLVDREGQKIARFLDIIPSRREIADWIAIPTAQALSNEPITSVKDRVQRFHYTRTFAEHVEGGMATAFSWVNIWDDYGDIVLSEGIRGEQEIRHALTNFPNWHIIELALDPISRLQRLSSRKSEFDQVEARVDMSFLPNDIQSEVNLLVDLGEISHDALTIIRAESHNYGLYPFADGAQFANYHAIDVADKTPDEVARDVHQIVMEINDAND